MIQNMRDVLNLVGNFRALWLLFCLGAIAIQTCEADTQELLGLPFELKTLAGRTYLDAKLQSVGAEGISITYKPKEGGAGIARIKFQDLPLILRDRFHEEEKKAGVRRREEEVAAIQWQKTYSALCLEASNRQDTIRAREENQAKESAEEEHQAAEMRRGQQAQMYKLSTSALRAMAAAGDLEAAREVARRDRAAFRQRPSTESRLRALNSLAMAAAAGNAYDQESYGSFLTEGGWIEAQDGINWLRKSAQAGNADAYHDLGMIYEHGVLLPRNIPAAANYYLLAAQKGPYGLEELARLYESDNNLIEAVKWHIVDARFMGMSRYAPVEALKKRMSPEQVEEGKRRAEQFIHEVGMKWKLIRAQSSSPNGPIISTSGPFPEGQENP